MGKALLGRKIGMTQIFDQKEELVPVTMIEAGPCLVTQIKGDAKDGYRAAQIGFGDVKEKHLNKPMAGHFEAKKVGPRRHLAEFAIGEKDEYQVGQNIDVSAFSEGEMADVVGTTKGKGFQGVVRRWGFKGGPSGHGSMFHRKPGAVGAGTDPGRVWKGQRMPGRMGGSRWTAKNLRIIKIDAQENMIYVTGSVPGGKGSLVMVRETAEKRAHS